MRAIPGPAAWAVAAALALAPGACGSVSPGAPPEAPGGDPDRGAALIEEYGCGACHVVPGVRNADGLVGPPLTSFGSRSYIAGALPNNGENLRRWLRDPQQVEPGTAMPDLGLTEADAEDITSYLFTLD